MKRALLFAGVLMVAMIVVFACAFAQDALVAPSQNMVKIYYFYTSYRCTNCYNMEKWTKEVVETTFKSDVDAGRLKLEIINTETKGNEHYAKEYQLFTKAVILSLVRDGKQVKYENLQKIWEKMKNKDAFCRYIQEGIAGYLKEL